MNALEALDKLHVLSKEIEALDAAYYSLINDDDKRVHATRIDGVLERLKAERDYLEDRLSAVKI